MFFKKKEREEIHREMKKAEVEFNKSQEKTSELLQEFLNDFTKKHRGVKNV